MKLSRMWQGGQSRKFNNSIVFRQNKNVEVK